MEYFQAPKTPTDNFGLLKYTWVEFWGVDLNRIHINASAVDKTIRKEAHEK